MSFLGVIINTATVIVGSVLGLLFKKGIPERVNKAVMGVVGLCVVYIGISGALQSNKAIVLIVSVLIGTIIGTIIKIQDGIDKLGRWVEKKFHKEGQTSVAEGIITGTLLFCIGAMTIVGGFEAGLKGDDTTYITKAILDFVSAFMLATTLGYGVCLSAVAVLIIQGGLVALSGLLSSVLSGEMIAELGAVGGIMIIALGLNLIGLTKYKVADMIPTFILVPFLYSIVITTGI